MKYLLEFPGGPSPLANEAPADQLLAAKRKLEAALSDGSIDAAYTKVGGGGLMVVNSSSHQALARVLRTYNVTDANVTPLLSTVDVIAAYHEAKVSGKVPPWVKAATSKKK